MGGDHLLEGMTLVTSTAKRLLIADARNRAFRSLLQALGIDVGISAVMLLLPVFTSADSWGDFQWKVLAFLLFKTAGTSALSFVMRRYLDSTGATPLPPANPGPDVKPEGGMASVAYIGAVLVVLAILLAFIFGNVLMAMTMLAVAMIVGGCLIGYAATNTRRAA